MKLKIIIFFLISLFFAACSSSQETAKEEEQNAEPEIYVFDDVTEVESDSAETVEEEPFITESGDEEKFYVQVGAFTTRERAESFVNENKSKLIYTLNISYSDEVMLYVVQLPPFETRAQAEEVRNELWQTETFNDAFILTK